MKSEISFARALRTPIAVLVPTLLPALTLLLLASAAAAGGPVSKGTEIFTGAISYSSAGRAYYEDADGKRTQEWVMTPGGGIFVIDGLAVELVLEGRWFSQGGLREDYWGWGPKVEYYLDTTGGDEPAGHALPYVGLAYLWGKTKLETPGSTDSTRFNSGMTSLSVGVSYLMTNHVAADLVVNYRIGTYSQKSPVDGVDYKADRWTVLLGIKAFIP